MDTQDDEHGRLLESFTTTMIRLDAKYPVFQGYGGNPRWWNYWGNHFSVSRNWNPKDICDIEYRNLEGQLHRIYGPAYINRLYEVQAWYKNGQRHREGGPAYIHKNNMVWFFEDKLHNFDGPAVIEGGGPKQYWIHGVRMSPKEYKKEIRRRKLKGLL